MSNKVSMIIRNAAIVTVDHRRRVIDRDGAIAVDNDRIMAVGTNEKVLGQYAAEKTIDARGMVLMPGLIDLHAHCALLRGLADDLELDKFLEKVYPEMISMTEVDHNVAAAITYLESIKAGTTCINEMAFEPPTEKKIEIVEKMGIRTTLSPMMLDALPGSEGAGNAVFDQIVESVKAFDGAASGRVRMGFGMESVSQIGMEDMRRIRDLSDKFNAVIHVHVNETEDDRKLSFDRHGKNTVDVLFDEGLLNGRCIAAHCVHMTDEEMDMCARSGAHVSHNPISNAKLGAGISPVPAMMEMGINIGIGHDVSACNNSRSIFEAMKFAALLHKAHQRNATLMPAKTILEMATINGASALGMDDQIGSIEVGKKADMLLVNLNTPSLTPYVSTTMSDNLISNLVYSMRAEAVDTVIIDGKLIMQGRQFLTAHEQQILTEAQQVAESLVERVEALREESGTLVES